MIRVTATPSWLKDLSFGQLAEWRIRRLRDLAELAVVKAAPYASRELDHVRAEMHGDVAITYGRYVARMKAGDPERQQFDLWFERVYVKRDGRWQYLSHRTVDGPHFSRVK